MIIGFSTGDLLWFDPVSSRYGRLNKQVRLPLLVYNIDYGFAYQTTQGRICNSPCTAVRWVPGSPNLFLVSHMDGTMIIYDKEREDGAFTPQEPTSTSSNGASSSNSSAHSDPTPAGEWNPLDSIFVTMPPWHPVTNVSGGGKGEKEKAAKNPVSHWKVSKKSIVGAYQIFSYPCEYFCLIPVYRLCLFTGR